MPLQPDTKVALLGTVQRSRVAIEGLEKKFLNTKKMYQLLHFTLDS